MITEGKKKFTGLLKPIVIEQFPTTSKTNPVLNDTRDSTLLNNNLNNNQREPPPPPINSNKPQKNSVKIRVTEQKSKSTITTGDSENLSWDPLYDDPTLERGVSNGVINNDFIGVEPDTNNDDEIPEPVGEENTPSSTGTVRIQVREPSETVSITANEPSETVRITVREPSETVRIQVREPSETVRITVREPSTDIVQIKVKEPYETVRITVSEPSTNPSYGSILTSVSSAVSSAVASAFASKTTTGAVTGASAPAPVTDSKLPILQSDNISVTTENITKDGIRNPVYKSITGYNEKKEITTKHYKISKLSEDEIKKYENKPPVKVDNLKSNTRYVYIDRSTPPPVTPSSSTTTSIPTSAATSTVATTPPGKTTPTNGVLFYLSVNTDKDFEGLLEKMDSPDIGYFLVKIIDITREEFYCFITRLNYEEANKEYDKKTLPPALKPVGPISKPAIDIIADAKIWFTIFIKGKKKQNQLFSYKSDYFKTEFIKDKKEDLTKKFAQNITDAKTKPAIYTEI